MATPPITSDDIQAALAASNNFKVMKSVKIESVIRGFPTMDIT